MKSIIICEGSTDYVLLQYFMRNALGWEDDRNPDIMKKKFKRIRGLKKAGKQLFIGECGGSSRILSGMKYILQVNSLSATESERYDKIVVITDRDESGTEETFLKSAEDILKNNKVSVNDPVKNNTWIKCIQKNGMGKNCNVDILLMVIPFEDTGAIETFLLNCIAAEDPYDAGIIQAGNAFVDNIDPASRYLTKRRYITKAKFDIYFSVRTAAEQFMERQNILKNVKWENYLKIQKDFEKLGDL